MVEEIKKTEGGVLSLPKGYKQTDVGIIPNDWSLKKIYEFTFATAGGTPSTSIKHFWGGQIKWMSSGELNNKRIYDVTGRITELGLKHSATKYIPSNSVLIGLAGQGKTRGTVAINYLQLCTNQSIAAIFPNNEVKSEYLYQNLGYRYLELRNLSSGDGGRGGLNLKLIHNFKIPLPPTRTEQTAIADALFDMDGLIEGLEKLIVKKRNIKQGAMQELLTGRKRLTGFGENKEFQKTEIGIIPSDWELTTIGEIITFQGGAQPSIENFKYQTLYGYIRLIQIRDYKSDKNITYIPKRLARRFCKKDDIMIGRYGPPIFQILKGIEGAYNVALIKAIPSPNVIKDYCYHLLKQECIFNFIESLSQRSGGQTGIDLKELKAYKVGLPVTKDEQIAITETLSNMDIENEKLETQLSKYKMLKTGMMQELLTGKKRLVKPAIN